MVRARIEGAANAPSPGSSVRVRVPIGPPRKAVAVPASAMRKGPGGDQVFVIELDKNGKTRAHVRQVESGAMLGDEVVIYAGLSAGERVAVSGVFQTERSRARRDRRQPRGWGRVWSGNSRRTLRELQREEKEDRKSVV